MQVVIIFILILAVVLVVFTLQNSFEISLHFLFWEIPHAPLVLVLICCIILGYLIASMYFTPRIWKLKKEYNHLIKFNKELKELHELNQSKLSKYEEESSVETNPEGIEFDDDDDSDSFFKD